MSDFSLKSLCKSRLKSMFIQLRQENPTIKNFILVVDQKTLKIISSYMKMSELLEQGINAVESLHLVRKPFSLDAIYFIQPSQESVKTLANDFNQENAQYKNAHVFFNNKIPSAIMQMIQNEQNLVRKIVTCKVFNLDFLCPNDTTFTVDLPYALDVYKGRSTTLIDIAEKLCTLLITFDKFYSFEIIFRMDNAKICQQLAQLVQSRLREILESLRKASSQSYDYQDKQCGKIRLLLVDRAIDPLTPLLHDFYYQSMFFDLLSVEAEIYQNEKGKKAILNDQDELLQKYKYKHIGEVLEGVSEDFSQFVKTNSAAKIMKDKESQLDLKQMTEIVRSMPQYQDLVSKYTMHMEIVEKSLDIFRLKGLAEIGELEQTLATGFDKKGSSISGEKIIQRILQSFQNPNLTDLDKLRLILAAIIQIDVVDKDRKQLTENINGDLCNAIHNLKFLGIQASKTGGKSHKRVNEQIKKYARSKMATEALELCRNTPFIEQQIEEMSLKDYNNTQGYEKIIINEDQQKQGQGKSLRQKGKIAQLLQQGDSETNINEKDKLIIFCVGGIGYNEIRSLNNNKYINQNSLVMVGSTALLKPNDYANELIKLNAL